MQLSKVIIGFSSLILVTAMNSYIIMLYQNVTSDQTEYTKAHIRSIGGIIKQELNLIKGFVADLPDNGPQLLANNPYIEFIEQDQMFTIQTNTDISGSRPTGSIAVAN